MTSQTAIHNQENKLAPAFAAELNVAAVTGYATSNDGMICVVRAVTDDGMELRLVIPTMLVASMERALAAVKMLAAAKTEIVAGNTNVFLPTKYEIITTDNFDGVLLAFDRGSPSETIIGLDHEAAFNMGQNLRKQVRMRQRLIIPGE